MNDQVTKYRKKPVEIEAIKWTGENEPAVRAFCPSIQGPFENRFRTGTAKPYLVFLIQTLEGRMQADMGDYIVKGIKGEFYPCKPDIFEASNDKVQP